MTDGSRNNGKEASKRRMSMRRTSPATDVLNAPMVGRVRLTDSPAPTLADPGGSAANSYGEAVERLQAATKGQILLVSPESRGAGAAAVALNLSVAATRLGLRTVLIDADLTGSGPTQFLRTGHGPGLIDLATGTADLKDASRLISVDRETRLPVVPRGRPGPEPEPQSPGLADAIDNVSEHSDLVLINVPADAGDAWRGALGAHADGSVLVVTGRESRADLGVAATHLAGVGAPVVGFIVAGNGKKRRRRNR